MRQQNCDGNFWELLEGFLEGNFVRRSSSFVDVYFLRTVFSGPPDVFKEQIPFSRLAEGLRKNNDPQVNAKKINKHIGLKEKLFCAVLRPASKKNKSNESYNKRVQQMKPK